MAHGPWPIPSIGSLWLAVLQWRRRVEPVQQRLSWEEPGSRVVWRRRALAATAQLGGEGRASLGEKGKQKRERKMESSAIAILAQAILVQAMLAQACRAPEQANNARRELCTSL